MRRACGGLFRGLSFAPGTLPSSNVEQRPQWGQKRMHGIIYLIGLIVVILAILSFFGLR